MAWALVAGLAYFAWPTWLGGDTTIITVSGKSMEPLYRGGDIVIARDTPPHVGDIVIYRPEGYPDAKIVHRIIGGSGASGWEMRGDNNDFTDPFTPTSDAVYGVAKVHIPHAGVVVSFITKPWVWISLFFGVAALLLWPARSNDDDDDVGGEPAESTHQDGESDELTRVESAVLAMIVAVGGLARGLRSRHPAALARATSAMVAITLFATGLLAAPHMASASALTVAATGVSQNSAAYCWPSSTAVTAALAGTPSGGNYSQLKVSSMPIACAGKAITVNAYSSAGALLATATGTAAAGDVTVTTSASFTGASVSYVVVTIGAPRVATMTSTPVLPATCVPTDVNGNPVSGTCTVTNVTVVDTWGSPGSRGANANFSATSSSGWFKVTFNFSQAPFPGWNPHNITGNISAPTSSCSALPLVTVNGPSWSNSQPPSYAYYFGLTEAGGNICP